jgi:signal transduction histidine kinase
MSDNAAKLLKDHQDSLPVNSPVPNRRILVVDDEPEIVAGIQQILCPATSKVTSTARSSRAQGGRLARVPGNEEFEVVTVTTSEEALAVMKDSLKTHRPFAMGFFDVVLTNQKMDGIELVKQIFAMDSKMYAVFVTAYQDRSVNSIGSLLGDENRERWDYINKPFGSGEILQKARNVTSLWDLRRLKEWQEERLSELNQTLLQKERHNTAAAVGRNVAHEFGNLLTHIIGNAELALHKNDLESMKYALGIILKAGGTATNVLQRFRKLNDAPSPKMKTKPIDVSQALVNALELVEFQFRKHFIRVNTFRGKAYMIDGNRHSLVQVFVNIFINSMHAMPDGGDIQISAREDGETVEIMIRDTGPGVPEEILPRLTEPMFSTKGAEGSGLGLSICKEIIEFEHAGELLIRNHSGGGLEVVIRLPLAIEKASSEKK